MLKKLVLILYLILTFLVCAHLDAEVTFSVPHEHTEVIYQIRAQTLPMTHSWAKM